MDIAAINQLTDPTVQTMSVRPISAGEFGRGERIVPGSVPPADRTRPAPAPTQTARPGEPVRGTAHQTNADGDSATFDSKLDQLTDEERQQLDKLKQRDTEVRTHEQAHVSAAGALFRGGPFYTYQTGPDGRDYAVGGNVKIDTSPGRTPEETVMKAAQMQRAALAPAEPSGADRAVAAKAAQMQAEAQAEIAKKQTEGAEGEKKMRSTSDATSNESSPVTQLGESFAVDVYA